LSAGGYLCKTSTFRSLSFSFFRPNACLRSLVTSDRRRRPSGLSSSSWSPSSSSCSSLFYVVVRICSRTSRQKRVQTELTLSASYIARQSSAAIAHIGSNHTSIGMSSCSGVPSLEVAALLSSAISESDVLFLAIACDIALNQNQGS
jgi:hypothetical protein